ncbi:MAG TPA: ABC transporter permease [Steroidobacteraceae bacterium]|nr:ABC transporter permease [Steroidobacteraceae bacterium]
MRILALEAHAECLRLLRAPAFSVPVIGFPFMFYVLFGIMLGPRHADPATMRGLVATFVVFGVMAPGLFGLGVTLALDRERGLLELKRALPMPAGIYLAAKVATAMIFSTIVSTLLLVTALTLGRVALELVQCSLLLLLALLGVVPFCALGLLVGTLTKGQAAAAVINLIYLPMSFLSGVFMPLSVLPHLVAQLAPLWPAYHLRELAMGIVGADAGAHLGSHVLSLTAMTTVFFAVARRRLQRKG